MKPRINVLFIAPLPPPMGGQALASEVLLQHLEGSGVSVDLVDLSKQTYRSGASASRVLEVAGILFKVFRFGRRADVIYFTISESLAGNLKDLFVFGLSWPSLQRMPIHLDVGAVMRVLMVDEHRLLRTGNRIFLTRMGAVIRPR